MACKTLRFNSRDEWLEARKMGIGASEVATVVGLNPYETPYQFWRRKMGIDEPKEMTFAMQAGHYLEDAVSLFFQDRTGHQIIKASAPDFMYVDCDKDFLRVSPDRTYWLKGLPHSESNKGILECKTTQKTIDENDLPKHWFCQLQMNLGVSGLQQGSIAWLTQGRTFGYSEMEFVPDFYQWLVEEVERFWVDNIIGKKEPDEVDVRDIVAKYSCHLEGKAVEVDEEVFNAYVELKGVKGDISNLETRKTELEDILKVAFKDAEMLTHDGRTIATWKAPKPSKKLNQKLFVSENPEMAEKYMEIVEGARRLLVKS